ncbi:hypothetical protein UT300003_33030 [Clostridium sardiniense]
MEELIVNNKIQFTTPLPPSVNDYLGYRVVWKNGKAIVFPYKKQEALNFMKLVANKLDKFIKEDKWKETDENTYVICEVDVFLNKKRRDSDNLFKVLLDSINAVEGLLYDDSLIIPRVNNVAVDVNNPRLEVILRVANKVGVFTLEEYKAFLKNNCTECTRYKRNCSLLKACVENKIKKEINLKSLNCSARRIKKKK